MHIDGSIGAMTSAEPAGASVVSITGETAETPETTRSTGRLRSLADVLLETDEKLRLGQTAGSRVWPTGFNALDIALTGGFRSGELVLLGGPQGLGKTAMALQMLRNTVAQNRSAIFFSYEHDAHSVLERLIAIEAGAIAGADAVSLTRIRQGFEARHAGAHSLRERFADTVGGSEAVEALERYGDRLHVHTSSGLHTTLEQIRAAVTEVTELDGRAPLVLL